MSIGNAPGYLACRLSASFRITPLKWHSMWQGRKSKRYRSLSVGVEKDFGGDALSERLPLLLADRFEELIPLYDYFWDFFRAARG